MDTFLELIYRKVQHTEYGDDHAVTEYLHGAVADAINAADSVATMQNVFTGGTERRRDLHGERLATTLARIVEYRQ